MSCSSLVSHRQRQARQGVHGIDEDDASVIENPLELGGGLRWLIRREECQPAVVDGVQATEAADETAMRPRARSQREAVCSA